MATEAVLTAERLTKVYRKEKLKVPALDGVDLRVREGEFLAIMGPSGSGKTTLLHLLGALDRPTSGRVTFRGRDLATMEDTVLSTFRRHHLGFVFQAFNLIPELRAWENVALPLYYAGVSLAERRRRALRVLTELDLTERSEHFPAELSGGEEQRVAVARALVAGPSVIMADEPTGNLDTATGARLRELFLELNRDRGITIVMVTHQPEMAEVAHRVVRLRDGRVEAS